jgi:two-component system NarL family sensor kinase
VAVSSLTYLLLLTWGFAVLITVLAAAGVSAQRNSVPPWAAALGVVLGIGTGVPVHRWLRPAVAAVLFSHPDDAKVLIAQVGHSLSANSPDLLTEIGTQISQRLRLPYVAIVTAGQSVPAGADGQPPAAQRLVRIPLSFAGEAVGVLLVTPRAREKVLSSEDSALLNALAVHVGIALRAAQVSADLQTSRAGLITAREEERRRIRRDLHDGLGPTLASLRLHLAAVQQLLPEQPDRALELVDRLRAEVRDTSGQVRGLVYGLRPPLLDDFGLLGALRSRAADVPGVGVRIDSPDPMPDLPAAVEVALYRIGCEALANVARHAAATQCLITLSLAAGQVQFRVDDDGRGLPDPLLAGVGLAGMRERAEELGGTLSLQPGALAAGAGTGLLVEMPCVAG